MEYRQTLPNCYQKPVPLNSELHAARTIGKSPTGFAFAAASHTVVLAGCEFMDASRFFPILFSAAENGPTMAVALLGLRYGENMFVGVNGEWQAGYIPAYVRRYPFITAVGEAGNTVVYMDEAFDGLRVAEGEALFVAGSPSPYLRGILDFMSHFQEQMVLTGNLCEQIRALGLLKPVTMNVTLGDGQKLALSDFMVVDEPKLAEIGKDARDALFCTGALAMIYAHLVSLKAMDDLVARAASR